MSLESNPLSVALLTHLQTLSGQKEWRVNELPKEINLDVLRVFDARNLVEFRLWHRANPRHQPFEDDKPDELVPTPMSYCGWFSPTKLPSTGGTLEEVLTHESNDPACATELRLTEKAKAEISEAKLCGAFPPVAIARHEATSPNEPGLSFWEKQILGVLRCADNGEALPAYFAKPDGRGVFCNDIKTWAIEHGCSPGDYLAIEDNLVADDYARSIPSHGGYNLRITSKGKRAISGFIFSVVDRATILMLCHIQESSPAPYLGQSPYNRSVPVWIGPRQLVERIKNFLAKDSIISTAIELGAYFEFRDADGHTPHHVRECQQFIDERLKGSQPLTNAPNPEQIAFRAITQAERIVELESLEEAKHPILGINGQKAKPHPALRSESNLHKLGSEDALAELERTTPQFDRDNGQWVNNKIAAKIEGLATRTLADYRQEGIKNANQTLGKDKDGRIWRREGTPSSHPWYFRATLKSILQKP